MEVAAFPKYDNYQESGIPWIGEIPAEWGLKKNKFIFKEQKGTVGEHSREFTLLSLTLKGVIPRDMENPQGKFPAEFNSYKQVRENDLIFCLFDIEETPRCIGQAPINGMITGAYTVITASPEMNSRYIYYYYLGLDYGKLLSPLYTGLRKVIQNNTFMGVKTPNPPLNIANRIVGFLDEKTAEIDTAIAKKQELIQLLNEQKSILINRAVTKGLNPDVKMKDSGVPWIGEIPEHWQVFKIKHLLKSMEYGLSESSKADGEYKYLNMGHIQSGQVIVKDTGYLNKAPTELLLKENDILFNRTNSFELVGKSGIFKGKVEDRVTFASYLVRLRTKLNINPDWLILLLNDNIFLKHARTLALRSLNQANLNPNRLAAITVPVPPQSEQDQIFSVINQKSSELEVLKVSAYQQIEALREFRQVLITSATTGKIKV